MKVVAFDPYLSPERATDLGVEKVELDALFRRADFITLHTPLTDKTRKIINADAIRTMRDGVRIINCARGGLIDEKALFDALQSGKVAGAAIDVYEVEPATDNILFTSNNVICTPHLGASTREAQENVAMQIAEQISDFLLDGAIVNALNFPSISAEERPKLMPFLKLAEQLGSFAGQTIETGLKSVRIEYSGAVASLNTKALTAAALSGVLTPFLEQANMISAPALAKERGIMVEEVTSRPGRGVRDIYKASRGNRIQRADGGRYGVRRRQAQDRAGRRHRHGSRARPAYALHGKCRQAWLHRRPRNGTRRGADEHCHLQSRPLRSGAAKRSRCWKWTRRFRTVCWRRSKPCLTSRAAHRLCF